MFGGMRKSLKDYDYKYIINPARRLWSSSLYPILPKPIRTMLSVEFMRPH